VVCPDSNGGTTIFRFVHHGVIPEDWAHELPEETMAWIMQMGED
jgi:hypothetical protein